MKTNGNETANELSQDQLGMVAGGVAQLPGTVNDVTKPKYGPAGSIAQGEINSNSLNNNLPDSGGGIIR